MIRNHRFSILINDQLVAKVNRDDSHENEFFTEEYVIPTAIIQSSTGTLKLNFLADPGSITGPFMKFAY